MITIEDTTVPTWTTAAADLDVTLECSDVSGLATAQTAFPVAMDNCDSDVLDIVKAAGPFVAGSCPNAGTYTNTWTVTDACSNTSAVYTQVITIEDTTVPTWTTAAADLDVTLECSDVSGLATAQAAFPVAMDNCDSDVLDIVKAAGPFVAGSCPNAGTYTNTWTVTDACSNTSAVYTQVITIEDTTVPTWTTAAADLDVTLECSDVSGLATAQAAFPVAMDNCDSDVLDIVKAAGPFVAGSCPNAGTYTNTWTVTDACSNTSAVYTQVITIEDTTVPTWTTAAADLDVTLECSDVSGLATAQAAFPVAMDNCDSDVLDIVKAAGPFVAGSCPNAGTYTNTWTVTDACSNTSAVYTQVITIEDTTIPTWTTAAADLDVTLECSDVSGLATAQTAFPVAMDNCDSDVLDIVKAAGPFVAGSCPNAGTYTNTWTVTDACSNTSAVYTQVITIEDTTVPTWTTAAADLDVTLECSDVSGLATAQTAFPVAMDNCDSDVLDIVKAAGPFVAGSCPNAGTYTNTWTVTDACSNTSAVYTQVITITDNTAPSFTSPLPANQSYNVTASDCNLVVPFAKPTATDNCGVATIATSATNSSGGTINVFDLGSFYQSTFPTGINTVMITATDACGNVTTHTFTVTIVDPIMPTITCPPAATGQCSIAELAPYTNAFLFQSGGGVLDDNCQLNPSSFMHVGTTSNGLSCPITYTRVYQISDVSGNMNTCSQTIVIDDTTPPTNLQIPANTTVSCANDTSPTSTGSVATATDNCPSAIIYSHADASTKGTDPAMCNFYTYGITRTWTATDGCGNATSLPQLISVVDNVAPMITSCVDIMVQLDGSGNYTLTAADLMTMLPDANVFDNCAPDANLTRSASITTFNCSNTGAPVSVTITVKDPCNNMTMCTVMVTVAETVPPVAVCPTNPIVLALDANGIATLAENSLGAGLSTDNCGTPTETNMEYIFNCSQLGAQSVELTATDGSGNMDTETCMVTVVDNLAPTIVGCPSAIALNNDPGVCGAVASWTEPTATDNCEDSTIARTDAGPANGAIFPVGTTTVTYMATDAAGNTSLLCSFNVVVTDTEVPTVVGCPSNITKVNDLGACGAVASWTEPSPADNCAGSTIARTGGLASGSLFPIGTTTVTYMATDVAGNQSVVCSFDVVVTDSESPTVVGCPSPIALNNALGECGAVATWTEPTPADNCAGSTIARTDAGPVNGALFPVGTTTVTYLATDAAGNTSVVCSFDVVVTDIELPTVVGCPSDITLNNDLGMCGAIATWTAPTSADNCAGHSIARTDSGPASGSLFPVGTTIVTYVATDAAGNMSVVCSFDVVVTDNEAAVIANCTDASRNTDDFVCSYTVQGTELDATFTDNCTSGSITNNFNGKNTLDGEVFPVGTTPVTWTVDDGHGQIVTCNMTLTVVDNQGPTVTCAADVTITQSSTSCFTPYSHTFAPIFDNCTNPGSINVSITAVLSENGDNVPLTVTTNGSGTYSITATNGLPVGNNVITLTATDANGVMSSCSYTVFVEDIWAPIISCPANITINAAPGACTAVATWNTPAVSDFCPSTFNVTSNYNSGASFAVGTTTTVNYTVVDNAGNESSCSFTVTVNGTCAPPASDIRVRWQTPFNGQFTAGQTKDAVIRLNEIGSLATTGTIQVFVPAVSGFTLSFNSAQTTATNPNTTVGNSTDGWSVFNYPNGAMLLTTNNSIPANGEFKVAINLTAVNPMTSSTLKAILLPGSGGDNSSGNNAANIIVSTN